MNAGKTQLQETSAATVRHGLDLLVGVIKKHAFYPEGNPTLQQAFHTFYEWLAAFLTQQETLRVTVEKNQLLYRGEPVQEESPGERTVIFPLFRDGVQWFEFVCGLSRDELLRFIRLINKYREQLEESENDLVTALWEAEFPNIRHKAVDKFWESETLVNLAGLDSSARGGGQGNRAPPTLPLTPELRSAWPMGEWGNGGFGGKPAPSDLMPPPGASPGDARSLALPGRAGQDGNGRSPAARMLMTRLEAAQSASVASRAADGVAVAGQEDGDAAEFWKLTGEEETVLLEMIRAEEQRSTARDCLGVLLAVIRNPLDAADQAPIQEFVVEEFRLLLTRGEFVVAGDFLERLAVVRQAGPDAVARFADGIAAKVAEADVLGVLNQIWQGARALPEDALGDLRRALLLLPPAAIETLAPMVARTGDPRTRAVLLEVVSQKAAQSRADVVPAIDAMPAELIRDLVDGYAARGQRPPVGLVTRLVRHREALVRASAAKALVTDNPENLRTVFHLLGDPDPGVRRWLFAHMGSGRNPLAERLLLSYLVRKAQTDDARNEGFVLDCYHALGGCASKASIGHLRRILMRKGWRALFGLEHGPHRVGAAMALLRMQEERGAAEVFGDAERSRYAGIRRSCAQARRELRRRGEETYG